MNATRLLAAAVLSCAGSSLCAQEKEPDTKPNLFAKATVEAWKKHGFYDYTAGAKLHVADLNVPVFRAWSNANTKDLPPVEVPFGVFLYDTVPTDADLEHLSKFKNLTALHCAGSKVTSDGLKHLAGLKDLVSLDLGSTPVTEKGLKHLAGLKKLTSLGLADTVVTDETLRALREVGLLHTIPQAKAAGGKRPTKPEEVVAFALTNTPVTAEGLKSLSGLKGLHTINLKDEQITDGAMKVLHDAGILHTLTVAIGKDARYESTAPRKPDDVTGFDLACTKATGNGVQYLSGFKNLMSLRATSDHLTGEGLKHLAALKSLTFLNLNSTKLNDDDLAHLAGLNNLSTLWLDGTRVTDKGLAHLAGMKNLTTLSLKATGVTGGGLKHLAGIKGFHTLNLDPSQKTDAALTALRDAGQLHALADTNPGGKRPTGAEEVLSLTLGSPVTDEGMKALSGLTRLATLNMGATRVTDAGLEHLAALKDLTVLYLPGKTVRGEGLRHLAGLKNLSTLWLGFGVADAELKNLAGLKKLSTLSVARTSDNTLKVLREAGLLHALRDTTSASGKRPRGPEDVFSVSLLSTEVTAEGVKHLAEFKNLQVLSIKASQGSRDGLKHLALLKTLDTIEVHGLTDDALTAAQEAGRLHNLSVASAKEGKRPSGPQDVIFLNLSNNAGVTDKGLRHLAEFKNLSTLSLSDTGVTDEGLKHLTELKSLAEVTLFRTAVSDDGVRVLRKALPNCKIGK